jgi:hypothetical protein
MIALTPYLAVSQLLRGQQLSVGELPSGSRVHRRCDGLNFLFSQFGEQR